MFRDLPGGSVANTSMKGDIVSIPSWGTKIPHASWPKKKKKIAKQKQYCNKFNKDFKNSPH